MCKTKSELAQSYFMQGYCCSQSVFLAFAEDFGLTKELALKVSVGLGGGVGRMREVCGAVTGAALVLGLKFGPDKTVVYPHVQHLMARFKAECGTYICRELLLGNAETGGAPEERTEGYYKKRPCANLVALSAQLLEEELNEK